MIFNAPGDGFESVERLVARERVSLRTSVALSLVQAADSRLSGGS